MAGDHDYFGSVTATYVFLAELGLSTSLLLVVLVTVLYSSTIHRSAVSVNVYLTFLIYSFSYLILPLLGQWNILEPPMGICLFSATMSYASFPLCAAAVLALSVSVWMNVFHHGSSHPVFERSLIIIPYIIWVGVIIESLVVGLSTPSEVVRHDYPYCIIENPIPGQTSRLLLAICLIPSMIFQTITLIRLFSVANPFSENPALRRAMRKRVIRMTVFNLGSVGALALSLSFSVTTHGNTIQVIIQGSCPLWAVLVFGTQREMFDSWLRWTRRKSVPTGETESKTHLVSISSIPSLEQV